MFNKKSLKLLYCAPTLWRKTYLFQTNPVFKAGEKLIFSRSSIVPKAFISFNVRIYTGKKWQLRLISKWAVGHKFGELTWNKKPAMYKAKQAKKKGKK